MKLHDFLVEHVMFPFPQPTEDQSAGNISQLEVGMREREWKAGYAVRDDTLVQKFCQVLEDTPFEAGAEKYLLSSFSPQLEVDEAGIKNRAWNRNPGEAQVSIFKRTLDFHSD